MTKDIILWLVFAYFLVGAGIACVITWVSMGFAGKFEPMAIVALLFWPAIIVIQIPGLCFLVLAIAAAGGLTWIVSLLLR